MMNTVVHAADQPPSTGILIIGVALATTMNFEIALDRSLPPLSEQPASAFGLVWKPGTYSTKKSGNAAPYARHRLSFMHYSGRSRSTSGYFDELTTYPLRDRNRLHISDEGSHLNMSRTPECERVAGSCLTRITISSAARFVVNEFKE